MIADDAPSTGLTIAIAQAVDPANAPSPRNPSERLIFRQLYDTLVRVDCEGRVLPGLADSWSTDQHGRVWRFRVQAQARFWDGTPVTARDILESWTANPAAAARTARLFAGMTALDERALQLELRRPTQHAYVFAHPDIAVARARADAVWPLGTGAFRPDSSEDARVIRIVPHGERSGPSQPIEFRVVTNQDSRSAIDARADVLIAGDVAAVEYARAVKDYAVTPLPWNRTYTLVTRPWQGSADSNSAAPSEALTALSRDAVGAETRAAEPPFWWLEPQCWTVFSPEPDLLAASATGGVMAYPRGDATARRIAERLAALAWPAARAPAWLRALLPTDYARAGAPTAQAFDSKAALQSIRTAATLAVVVPLPRSAAPCVAPALFSDVPTLATATVLRITPLLDARDYLLYRRGIGAVMVDGDGTLRFAGPR